MLLFLATHNYSISVDVGQEMLPTTEKNKKETSVP